MAPTRPKPTSRVPLSRDRVLAAAIRLADERGLEALTMRRLAQDLGVEAMSLYYHVERKDDLLDGILDLAVREIEVPGEGPDWRAAVRGSAISFHEALLRHPWAGSLILSPARVSPARLRYMDALLGRLRAAGFSAEMTHHAYHALDSHIIGYTLWEAGIAIGAADLRDLATTFLSELPEDLPFLAEHVEQHLAPSSRDDNGEFEFGLDLILDGLERLRDGS